MRIKHCVKMFRQPFQAVKTSARSFALPIGTEQSSPSYPSRLMSVIMGAAYTRSLRSVPITAMIRRNDTRGADASVRKVSLSTRKQQEDRI
jgi:hypothetical protein